MIVGRAFKKWDPSPIKIGAALPSNLHNITAGKAR